MYIFGASGHGKVIAEIAEENNIPIKGFIDSDQSKNKVLDYKVVHEIPIKHIDVVVSIGNNAIRKMIVNNNLQGVKIKSYAYPDEFIKHGSVDELEKIYGLDEENIINGVNKS